MLLSLRDLARRARCDEGFTMINVMLVMFAVMGISVGAFAATGSDLRIGVFDRSSKQAYAAAEAGIAEYLSKVNGDNAYWRLCANRPVVPAHIGQRWDGTAPDPRAWRGVPDSNAEYTIELLPANGASACNPSDANGTMLDGRTGAFQIRVTGRVRGQGGRPEGKRSLIATFKRTSFLEFLYFTDYETSDPIVKEVQTYGKITRPRMGYIPDRPAPSLPVWASENCDSYYRDGRDALRWYRGDDVDSPGDGNLNDDGAIYWPDPDVVEVAVSGAIDVVSPVPPERVPPVAVVGVAVLARPHGQARRRSVRDVAHPRTCDLAVCLDLLDDRIGGLVVGEVEELQEAGALERRDQAALALGST